MRPSSKKIAYGILAFLGIAFVAVLLVRATYKTDFLSVHSIPLDGVEQKPSVVSAVPPPPVASDLPAGDVSAAPAAGSTSSGTGTASTTAGPRLSIPSIGVNAPIEDEGLDGVGNMQTPYHLANVGWYEYGTPIGDVGSAVIAGHVDNELGTPAVFYNLKKVQKGDDIYVTNTDGTKLHFVVADIEDYSLQNAPVAKIFNDTSGQRIINLITCEKTGAFTYNDRIVVTAVLAAS